MTSSYENSQKLVDSVPFWFHSIDVGSGVVTRGHKTAEQLRREWDQMQLPDLRGKTVLDINTWDGFFAFESERRGIRYSPRLLRVDHGPRAAYSLLQ